MTLNRQRAFRSPLPACGERSKFASSEFRVRGILHESCSLREPLTPTLSPRKSGEREKLYRAQSTMTVPSLSPFSTARCACTVSLSGNCAAMLWMRGPAASHFEPGWSQRGRAPARPVDAIRVTLHAHRNCRYPGGHRHLIIPARARRRGHRDFDGRRGRFMDNPTTIKIISI